MDPSDAEVIEADVPRSCVPQMATSEADVIQRNSALRRILRAWCILRPDVGYSQGMNVVAALCLALCGLDEENAFTLFVALLTRVGLDYYSSSPQPLAGFQRDVDVLLDLVGEAVPALDPSAGGAAAKEVLAALRPWCCGCFLPLWINVLPMDCVLGVFELLLEPEDVDTPYATPSSCNVAVALAVLNRIGDTVLATVSESLASGEDDFAAYPALVQETRKAFSDPERLLRDARRLRPAAERLETARRARHLARSASRVHRPLLADLYEHTDGHAQSKLTGERFEVLRRMLLDNAAVSGPSSALVDGNSDGHGDDADGDGGANGHDGEGATAAGATECDGIVVRERLEGALALLIGGRLASDWAHALCDALGPSATALQFLTALACHVHAGLLERLELIFTLHAGDCAARLGPGELHTLTRTMLALSLAATDAAEPPPERARRRPLTTESSDDDDDDNNEDVADGADASPPIDALVDALQRPFAPTKLPPAIGGAPSGALSGGAASAVAADGGTEHAESGSTTARAKLRAVVMIARFQSRLALINRRAAQIAWLLRQLSEHGVRADAVAGAGGITLTAWREGCLSQPDLLDCFADWSPTAQKRPGRASATRRMSQDVKLGLGAAHPDSPLKRGEDAAHDGGVEAIY